MDLSCWFLFSKEFASAPAVKKLRSSGAFSVLRKMNPRIFSCSFPHTNPLFCTLGGFSEDVELGMGWHQPSEYVLEWRCFPTELRDPSIFRPFYIWDDKGCPPLTEQAQRVAAVTIRKKVCWILHMRTHGYTMHERRRHQRVPRVTYHIIQQRVRPPRPTHNIFSPS